VHPGRATLPNQPFSEWARIYHSALKFTASARLLKLITAALARNFCASPLLLVSRLALLPACCFDFLLFALDAKNCLYAFDALDFFTLVGSFQKERRFWPKKYIISTFKFGVHFRRYANYERNLKLVPITEKLILRGTDCLQK
jgi:hypothetical protein